MDNRDQKIKEILQKDKLISKKADDIFNNFLKEEKVMGEEKKIKSFPAWKKGLATAACLAVVLGGANIYASTNGYGNVFFMVRYLITGEKPTIVTGKDAILSDRDMTISYEPIQLTENIKMQVRGLQIKDNKAKLILAVQELQFESDDGIVPLKYKVTDNNSNVLCEMTSNKGERRAYIDELELNNFTEEDRIINLEVSKNNGEKLTKLVVDLENKTITVEGEEEAMKKVSEIELKKFLGLVSAYPRLNGVDEDKKILLAINANTVDESNGIASIGNDDRIAIEADRVNKILKEIGYNEIASNFTRGQTFHKVTYNGKDYYQYNSEEKRFGNTCINISNISYTGTAYKVTFTYTDSLNTNNGFDIKTEDINVYEGTVYFKINENNEIVKYQIIRFENMITIYEAEENNEENEETYPEEEYEYVGPAEEEGDGEHINPWQNVQPTTTPGKDNQNEETTNDISTLNWLEYWSPGLWVQYPDTFDVTTYSDMYWGSDINYADEKTVEIEGDLKGIDENTQQPITSHLKITVYMPEYVEEKMSPGIYFENAYKTIFKEELDRENAISEGPNSIFDGECDYSVCRHKDGKSYGLYTRFRTYEDYDTGWGYKIVFESDNMENPKVRNAIYKILDNLRTTSF